MTLERKIYKPDILKSPDRISYELFEQWINSLAEIRRGANYDIGSVRDYFEMYASRLGLLEEYKRRKEKIVEIIINQPIVEGGYVYYPLNNRIILPDGDLVNLSPTESRLFAQLISNYGEPVSQDVIKRKVWPQATTQDTRDNTRVYVLYLRKKIKDNLRDPVNWHIQAIKNTTGYILNNPDFPKV